MRKLDNAQFVELYYWTNKGLSDARLVTAAGVIADRLLTPLDFSRAVPRFIASLEQRGWVASRVRMLAQFFGGLMLHDYWTSDNQIEQRALLVHQEEQRRAWHQAISQPAGAWNISILDETEISRCFDRIYHAERVRIDHDFDLKVSPLHSF